MIKTTVSPALQARSILVISDNSRATNEADAESIRAAVLIDESIQSHAARLAATDPAAAADYVPPHVVMEIQKSANCGALEFATNLGTLPS